MLGQVLPAQLYHLLVQVDHRYLFYGPVRQGLPQRSAFPASPDEHAARVGMQQHGRMDQRLVVNVLVAFGRLGLAVQEQAASVHLGMDHFHPLVTRVT